MVEIRGWRLPPLFFFYYICTMKIKCTGYYTEPQSEIDVDYYEKLGLPIPELKESEMIETRCWIENKDIQAIFDRVPDRQYHTYKNPTAHHDWHISEQKIPHAGCRE